jgi:hypothetical protein
MASAAPDGRDSGQPDPAFRDPPEGSHAEVSHAALHVYGQRRSCGSLSRVMRLRIIGLTANGEARIVDEHNRLVAFGELRVGAFIEPELGDLFDVEVAITWVPELRAPDGEVDWDDFPR